MSSLAATMVERDCRMRFLGLFSWLACMHVGLNVNRFWFLNFYDAPSFVDDYFKFWFVSGQIFSEILRFLESWRRIGNWACCSPMFRDFWLAFSEKHCLGCKWFSKMFRIPVKIGYWVLNSRRRIGNQVCDSPRIFFNNISMVDLATNPSSKFWEYPERL
jgi:hypothetical protein